jgi:signal transduction histidine kinase
MVTVDETEIQEVFINLIRNSIYWINTSNNSMKKIAVSVQQHLNGELEVIFADSGPGIMLEDGIEPHIIFSPYFSTQPNGTGLGLTIVGEIVKDFYDGEVLLIESNELPGATFKIILRKRV